MNVLLIGSGGREHAFAYKLKQSKNCKQLYMMPGNAGTTELGINVNISPNKFEEVGNFCIQNKIELIVVGPEEPLVLGIKDYFLANESLKNILFIGPDKMGANIEASKDWSKVFMEKYKIPTASYQTFNENTLESGIEYIHNQPVPIVLKADGLAAGKGVLICNSKEEAIEELKLMINDKKFGQASSKVVIESFLSGIELSVFVLTDGNSYKILPTAKDYKRIGEGDTGLNTGGMGAISPVPFANKVFMDKVIEKIVEPTINGLKKENIHYVGFIFIGLIKVNEEPMVIEYNCRMGDPETEAVLPLIETDFLDLMVATASQKLYEIDLKVSQKHAATVVLVSGGYPQSYQNGKTISFPAENQENTMIFHAGTKLNELGKVVTNGGRVLAITTLENDLNQAVAGSIKLASNINFEGKYFRSDIGYEFK